MIHNCYIDDFDCRTQYGVWIERGGYNDLFAFPALKKPDSNDWPEVSGIEVDLSDPKLKPLTVTVDFVSSGGDTDGFVALLAQPGYRSLSVPSLGRTWKVRLSDSDNYESYRNLDRFSLSLIIDTPVRADINTWFIPGVSVTQSAYELDDVNFADFGIFVRSGKTDVLKAPAVKRNLTRTIETIDGQICDTDSVVYKAKEVSFNCCLKAATMEQLWSCYDAFFNQLIQPDERTLYVAYMELEYPCYYKQMTNPKLEVMSEGLCMISFKLTLVFTSVLIGESAYLLATEDDFLLVDEEDEDCFIDMSFI